MYNYDEILQKIESSRRFGKLPGVEVEAEMLKSWGEPQKKIPFIHVAGTNGKGSVCAFLSSILEKYGLRVGRFISPHLMDFRERITINGDMIPREAVTRLGNAMLERDYGMEPTMFDYCLLMAVLYFKEQHCDVMVIETGLGGRLDSTNALGTPDVAVITRIGYDHMAILGDTLAQIAAEKAGIIKPGVSAVFAPQEKEALDVLRQKADGRLAGEDDIAAVKEMHPLMLGDYQLENAAAAMLAAQIFLGDTQKAKEAIRQGIRQATWPGRMEILSENPYLMVDGAHNSNGIHALCGSLKKLYPGEKFHFVMGVMADKDYPQMVEELLPLALDFVTVTVDSERALQGEQLAAWIKGQGVPARSLQKVNEALSLPVPGAKTIALGSLYFIGELRALWQQGG